MKKKAPENSLGIYLTHKDISNIQICALTDISTSEISRLRNGKIGSIPAVKLYLISLVTGDSIQNLLRQVYPSLKLKSSKNFIKSSIDKTLTELGDILNSAHTENNSLEIISERTGIKMPRLKDLVKKDSSIVLAHELYLLELATSVEPGAYFKKLYSTLKLKS